MRKKKTLLSHFLLERKTISPFFALSLSLARCRQRQRLLVLSQGKKSLQLCPLAIGGAGERERERDWKRGRALLLEVVERRSLSPRHLSSRPPPFASCRVLLQARLCVRPETLELVAVEKTPICTRLAPDSRRTQESKDTPRRVRRRRNRRRIRSLTTLTTNPFSLLSPHGNHTRRYISAAA